MKLSDYVWKYIEELGVRHVFMFPGGGAMHLVDSLGKNSNLDLAARAGLFHGGGNLFTN